jgi:hypothetical protein
MKTAEHWIGGAAELFTEVGQAMYPCDVSTPKPVAVRAFRYLSAHGRGGAA